MEEKEEEKINFSVKETNKKISILTYLFGLFIFFIGLIYDRIKERKSGIKRLLYLNGINNWSYWISYFIFDYIKLIIISLLLILPMISIK